MYRLVGYFLREDWLDNNCRLNKQTYFAKPQNLIFQQKYWDQALTEESMRKIDKWMVDAQEPVIAALGFKPHFYYCKKED